MAETLTAAGDAWLRQVVGGLGPLFVLGALLFALQRWTQASLARVIGWRGMIYWTGWLGTPIHELSHLIVGRLFFVRITESRLFSPDPDSGVLGYVRYRIPRMRLVELPQVIGVFMMGIAPLFGGALALLLVRWTLVDEEANAVFLAAAGRFAAALSSAPYAQLLGDFGDLIVENFRPLVARSDDWRVWVYLYASLAIGTHLAPSGADLRGGRRGFLVLAVLTFAANLVAVAVGADAAGATAYIARVTGPMATLLTLALVLNVGHGAAAFVLAQLIGRRRV